MVVPSALLSRVFLPRESYCQVVLKPLGPLRVRMLPVLASKVLVSK
ncbi:hypothetical protein [uncultured Gammaproteobacteria bacterium]|nr:hypothetical protein [uncultured Gammaproteobacteria bacterium]